MIGNVLKILFSLFWIISTASIAYMAYIIFQTEYDPRVIWAWMVMCSFSFVSATIITYNIVFAHYHGRSHSPETKVS